MATGNTKSEMWALSVRPPKDEILKQPKEKSQREWEAEALRPILEGYQKTLLEYTPFAEVHTNIHDKDDYNKDDAPSLELVGQPKAIHCHFWIKCAEATKGQMLRMLAELLKCKKEQLSLDPTFSECLMVQYLTHKNDKEKYQYEFDAIQTTNAEKLDYRYSMKYEEGQSEAEKVREAVFNAKNLTELCDKVGIENTRKYMGLFDRIKQEREIEKKTAEEIGRLMKRVQDLEKDISTQAEEANGLYKFKYDITTILDAYRQKRIDAVRFAEAVNDYAKTGYLPYDIQAVKEAKRKRKPTEEK